MICSGQVEESWRTALERDALLVSGVLSLVFRPQIRQDGTTVGNEDVSQGQTNRYARPIGPVKAPAARGDWWWNEEMG